MRRIKNFLKNNKWKKLTIYTWFLMAYYRLCILLIPPKKMQNHWGERGAESTEKMTRQAYIYAKQTAWIVNYVADRTPWQSKCLVRALSAQHLMKRHHIQTTLYLGVGKDEEGNMTAHAWIRCGKMFLSGGDGTGYGMVAKFVS